MENKPEILAPAGGKLSFLSAIAAGADAVYCGLKLFSARMTADNFSVPELSCLTELAHSKNIKVYLAFNTLIKNSNIEAAYRSISEATEFIKPDAYIIQDTAAEVLARKSGFNGELHYSTLSNITHPAAIAAASGYYHADRVVLPRELSLEEIKICAKSSSLSLEVFIHGALCYGISGRCYWSSYLGGKSSLRGRCVQPCRRIYVQDDNSNSRFFSCMDLGLADSIKGLLSVEKVKAWKIEGRKKGPHYVYSTVKAYNILRDHSDDTSAVKEALSLLDSSLGRKKTKYYFNNLNRESPVQESGESGSGLLAGKINNEKGRVYFTARSNLFKGDLLRIGYEDSESSDIIKIDLIQEMNSRMDLTSRLSNPVKSGTPVFLIDRRSDELMEQISILDNQLVFHKQDKIEASFSYDYTVSRIKNNSFINILLSREPDDAANSYWLEFDVFKNIPENIIKTIWWWLPPVIWPKEEKNISNLIKLCIEKGCSNFILNSPWQIKFFENNKSLNIWAGPYCNIANSISVKILSGLGFKGVILSPELGINDIVEFHETSALPLGIFVSGNWPVSISRAKPGNINTDKTFSSALGESYWTSEIGSNFWTFPNWILDLTPKIELMKDAGISLFVYGIEKVPEGVSMKKRQGLWNWDHGLM